MQYIVLQYAGAGLVKSWEKFEQKQMPADILQYFQYFTQDIVLQIR